MFSGISDLFGGNGSSKNRLFTDKLEVVINSVVFETVILVMIIANVIVMASEHYGQSESLTNLQTQANYLFVFVFNFEMIMKVMVLGFKRYCSDNFNLFDAVVNILSVIDIMMPDVDSNMLAFRAVRLFRVFKLVKS